MLQLSRRDRPARSMQKTTIVFPECFMREIFSTATSGRSRTGRAARRIPPAMAGNVPRMNFGYARPLPFKPGVRRSRRALFQRNHRDVRAPLGRASTKPPRQSGRHPCRARRRPRVACCLSTVAVTAGSVPSSRVLSLKSKFDRIAPPLSAMLHSRQTGSGSFSSDARIAAIRRTLFSVEASSPT